MIRIHCSKKLQDFIKNVETFIPTKDINRSLSDWNAHLFFVDKRKCIIVVNNLTAYSIFITDIVKKDLKNFETLFFHRLEEQLKHDKQNNQLESVESFFQVPRLKFYKTNNDRKTLGRINDFMYNFKGNCFHRYAHLNDINLGYENGLINTTPTGKPGEIKKTWSSPIENMNEIKNQRTTPANRQ